MKRYAREYCNICGSFAAWMSQERCITCKYVQYLDRLAWLRMLRLVNA